MAGSSLVDALTAGFVLPAVGAFQGLEQAVQQSTAAIPAGAKPQQAFLVLGFMAVAIYLGFKFASKIGF